MNNLKNVAVIVTTYCGEPEVELKRHMTKTLVKTLSETGCHVCLVSHTTIDEDTQQYCDSFIYDKDNSFKYNGLPIKHVNGGHGIAELKSIVNAVNFLNRFPEIKYVLKVTYDVSPDLDYNDIITKCLSTNKKMVTAKWYEDNISLGTLMMFSEINFLKQVYSLDEIYRCDTLFHNIGADVEHMFFDSVRSKNLLHELIVFNNYKDFFGYDIKQYCHLGGSKVEDYPYI